MPRCPACDRPLPDGDVVECTCGQWSRVEERPERPCACGQALVLDGPAVRCPSCGVLQSADPDRALRTVADCPRCRRRIDVDPDASEGTCPHCQQVFSLRDTL